MLRQNNTRENREPREPREVRDGRENRENRETRDRDNYVQRPPRQYERIQRQEQLAAQQAAETRSGLTLADLETRSVDDLQDMAKELDISGYSRLKKQDLAFRILQAQTEQQGNIFGSGVLDIVEDGYGFLRQERFLPGPEDVYVSQSQIRKFGLRTGDFIRMIDNQHFHRHAMCFQFQPELFL